jgi:hypothetical protein
MITKSLILLTSGLGGNSVLGAKKWSEVVPLDDGGTLMMEARYCKLLETTLQHFRRGQYAAA